MSGETIGICSLCGGDVRLPLLYRANEPGIPECESCHAIQRYNRPPIIEMRERGNRLRCALCGRPDGSAECQAQHR